MAQDLLLSVNTTTGLTGNDQIDTILNGSTAASLLVIARNSVQTHESKNIDKCICEHCKNADYLFKHIKPLKHTEN